MEGEEEWVELGRPQWERADEDGVAGPRLRRGSGGAARAACDRRGTTRLWPSTTSAGRGSGEAPLRQGTAPAGGAAKQAHRRGRDSGKTWLRQGGSLLRMESPATSARCSALRRGGRRWAVERRCAVCAAGFGAWFQALLEKDKI